MLYCTVLLRRLACNKIQIIVTPSGTHTYMHTPQRRSDETSQRMAYSHVCLLMSLLRETPILDGDRNPRRFIARLSLYSDLSFINQLVFVGRAQTEPADFALHLLFETFHDLQEHTNLQIGRLL